jgi:hypothetical protein
VSSSAPRHPEPDGRTRPRAGCDCNHFAWDEPQNSFGLPARQASIVRCECDSTAEQRAHRKVFCGGRRPLPRNHRAPTMTAMTATATRAASVESRGMLSMSPNAAVQRPRAALPSAARVHNEMTHMRCARADVSRSAATACYAAPSTGTCTRDALMSPTNAAISSSDARVRKVPPASAASRLVGNAVL